MALKLGEYKCAVDEYRGVLAAQGAELAAKPQMRTVLLAKLQEAEAAEAASWKQAFMAEAAAAEEEEAAAAAGAEAASAGAETEVGAAAEAEVEALEAQLALGARLATPEQAAEP